MTNRKQFDSLMFDFGEYAFDSALGEDEGANAELERLQDVVYQWHINEQIKLLEEIIFLKDDGCGVQDFLIVSEIRNKLEGLKNLKKESDKL